MANGITFTPITPVFGTPEEDKGILASILDSIAKDIKGATKVGLALPFSGLEALGAEVPFTFDDLTTRDWVGAASIASIGVGGLTASAARSVLAGQGLRAIGRGAASAGAREAAQAWATRASVAQRAALLAGAEASAGVFFGSVKPLESGEDRLEAILGDAALFGVFGAGTSVLASGFRATIGARLAQLKGTTRAALLQQVAQRREASRLLAEFAGITLRRTEDGAEQRIHRLANGQVRVWESNKTEPRDFESFNDALLNAFNSGFEQRVGLSRSRLASEEVRDALPEEVLSALNASNGDLSSVIDSQHFANYRATREALAKAGEESGLWSWLAAETSVPTIDGLASPSLSHSFRSEVLRVVPQDVARSLAKIDDNAEFLRRAALEGALDVDNLLTGSEMQHFVDELFLNDLVPETSSFRAYTPYDATIFSYLGTPGFIAKIHPEIQPFANLLSSAAERQIIGTRDAKQFLFELEQRVGPEAANRAVEIIDQSASAGGVRAARAEALRLAQETNDPQVIDFVESVTERLNMTRLRLIAAGRLGGSDATPEAVTNARNVISRALEAGGTSADVEAAALASDDAVVRELIEDAGLAGYFPIVHSGQVRVDINGVAEPAFFDSFNEARRFLAEDGRGGFISTAFATDASIASTVSPREFGRLVKILRSVDGVEISATEAAEMLKEAGTLPSTGPRKFSRHLLPRRLGTRDFADDPFRALELYLSNAERTLAFNTFEREANRIIENLPAAKSALKKWAEYHKDIALGRPTWDERLVSKVIANVAPEVSQAALRRYSGFLRWGQGLFKLGGALSGIVNATQYAINTVPLLGARWAAEGLKGFFNPAIKARVEALVAKHNVDLGLHVSLTREGHVIGAETISGEIRAAIKKAAVGNKRASAKGMLQAAENIWMFSFNTAERMNRLGTFWGAFRKASAEGMSEDAAVAFARDLVRKTQFDYSIGNLPAALQGPVGSVLGQFKTFFINEIELIASLDNATRLKMALMAQALGGAGAILALPGVDLIDAASRHFFDVKASEAIKLEGGREDSGSAMRLAAFGVPGLFNADFTNYIGPGGFSQLAMGWLGPTVSDASAWVEFFGSALRDIKSTGYLQPTTINTWMQQVMPAQIRRYARGQEIFKTGDVRNPYSGKLLYRPDQRLKAAAVTAIGIPSVRASMDRIQNDVLQREIEAYRESRESYRRQIALAFIRGDQQEAQRLQTRAASGGYVFDARSIRDAVRDFQATAGERREARTPRTLRTEFEDFYGLE